jgi:class 3 adenylate cyclase/tetratricopeptide (TPR) repeat protein
MICASCGTENREGRKFCSECAAPLAVSCPACGAPNQPGEKFCGECATPLVDARAGQGTGAWPVGPGAVPGSARAGSDPGPVAERRLVTVLFADLVGFTPFAEEKDPEEVRELLTRYFDLSREIIGRYGGTVEKFIGDAVMAVWGAPVAQEDDSERAVRAALELADAVRGLGPAIQARCGVLTGEAAVTLGATNEGLVAGDLVNTAARLQSVAPPGSVLVGEPTMRATSAAIAFEEAGPQVLKGKTAPVAAWRALRVVAERGGRGRSDLPEPPFVGRDEELRLLKDQLTATGRDRKARLVSIAGPGGIGKSRLAWELEKYADGLSETVYWHRGRSPAYGEGISFWALGEMVRRRAGLAEGDDEPTTRERIAATVAEHVPADEDRRWVEPALLTLLGLEPAPAGGRDVLFAAWRIFFERVAERATTILLFEDLQWADSGLLDFIDHLLTWSRSSPILVVTLARPELLDRRPGWGSSARSLTTLALEPLPDEAMRELLAGLVPGLPDSAVERILGRADGIPLYAVETIRALVADGRLAMTDGIYRPVGDLTNLAIPDTLRSLIASRLDALELRDRGLVQTASVLGQTFTLDGLAATTGEEARDLEPRLAKLVRRELLSLEADPRSPERGQYAFVQSLIREVAYGTLARRDRRERHLAVARWYESLGDEEFAGALASHYVDAHRASSPGAEADAVAVQAGLALRGAADRAAALGAHDEAVAHLERALEVSSDAAQRAELLLRAARSADAASRYTQAVPFAEDAAVAFEAAGDLMGVVRARAVLGAILIDAARIAEARDVLEAALTTLDEDADRVVRAELLSNLSRALIRADEPARAIEVADQALAIAERLDLELVVAETFNNKGSSLDSFGRRREAVALLEASVRVAQAGGFVGAELRALANLGAILRGEDPRRARDAAREGLDLARRVGHRMMANWLMGSVLIGAFATGVDWEGVLADGEEALVSVTDPGDEKRILTFVTLLRISRGDPVDAAMKRLETLLGTTSDASDVQMLRILRSMRFLLAGEADRAFEEAMGGVDVFSAFEQPSLRTAARAALWVGDLERARAVASRYEAVASTDTDTKLSRASLQAGIAALEGRRQEAIATQRDLLRQWLDRGDDFEAALHSLSIVLLVGASGPAARALADETRSILERIGARPYLAKLDEALARSPIEATAGADAGARTDPESRAGTDLAAVDATLAQE